MVAGAVVGVAVGVEDGTGVGVADTMIEVELVSVLYASQADWFENGPIWVVLYWLYTRKYQTKAVISFFMVYPKIEAACIPACAKSDMPEISPDSRDWLPAQRASCAW